jgi:AcrR family transcriptional regulator
LHHVDRQDMTRKYDLKQRAQSQAETRRRIVEATVKLHGSVGPARTTISAIAQRAGVQRLTVYRHFPDERSLFQACSGHWAVVHPRPDVSRWATLADPEERLRVALGEIYAYYRATEEMTANVRRDLPQLPVLQEVAQPFARYWDDARAALDRGWKARGRRRRLVRAVIAHAVEFETWRSLARQQGLEDVELAEMMARLARTVQA